MKVFNILCLAALVLLSSCGNNNNQRLKDEVIAIHDSAMLLMTDIKSRVSIITEKIDSLNASDSILNAHLVQLNEERIHSLENAHKQMMEWMHQFDEPVEEGKEAVKEYLTEQKLKIIQVHAEMRNALTNSREILENE